LNFYYGDNKYKLHGPSQDVYVYELVENQSLKKSKYLNCTIN